MWTAHYGGRCHPRACKSMFRGCAGHTGALPDRQPWHRVCAGALGLHQPRRVLPYQGAPVHGRSSFPNPQQEACRRPCGHRAWPYDCQLAVQRLVPGYCSAVLHALCIVGQVLQMRRPHIARSRCMSCQCLRLFGSLPLLIAGSADQPELPLQVRAVCAFCQRRLLQLQRHCRHAPCSDGTIPTVLLPPAHYDAV